MVSDNRAKLLTFQVLLITVCKGCQVQPRDRIYKITGYTVRGWGGERGEGRGSPHQARSFLLRVKDAPNYLQCSIFPMHYTVLMVNG